MIAVHYGGKDDETMNHIHDQRHAHTSPRANTSDRRGDENTTTIEEIKLPAALKTEAWKSYLRNHGWAEHHHANRPLKGTHWVHHDSGTIVTIPWRPPVLETQWAILDTVAAAHNEDIDVIARALVDNNAATDNVATRDTINVITARLGASAVNYPGVVARMQTWGWNHHTDYGDWDIAMMIKEHHTAFVPIRNSTEATLALVELAYTVAHAEAADPTHTLISLLSGADDAPPMN